MADVTFRKEHVTFRKEWVEKEDFFWRAKNQIESNNEIVWCKEFFYISSAEQLWNNMS
jgi:hypothetical protein